MISIMISITFLLSVVSSCNKYRDTISESDMKDWQTIITPNEELLYYTEEESDDGKYTIVYEKIDDVSCSIRNCIGELPDEFHIPSETKSGIRVTEIQNEAFKNSSESLKEVWIPDSVKTIGAFPFGNGSNELHTVHLGSGVQNIDSYMFYNDKIDTLTLNSKNPYFELIDSNYLVERNTGVLLWALNAGNIPEGIEHIGDISCRFSYENITVPEGVKTIGKNAFIQCFSSNKVVLPDSVVSIGESAFYGVGFETVEGGKYVDMPNETFSHSCIQYIYLPDTVTSIGEFAFSYCNNLKTVYIPASVTSIGEWAFSSLKDCTIICEAESQPDGWSENWLRECENTVVIFGGTHP